MAIDQHEITLVDLSRGRATRRSSDPFDFGLECAPGSRPSRESWIVARRMAVVLGTHAPVVNRYIAALSYAPKEHLERLRKRGTRVLFGPTIADALGSDWAAEHRGWPLTAAELWELRVHYSEADTAAVYDSELDLLVLPTGYAARDLERIVLHELGHALTFGRVSCRPNLLQGLPPEITRHVRNCGYGEDSDPATIRHRTLEVLAEAFVFVVVGRAEELPEPVLSELIFILGSVAEDETRLRFDFDDETGRTATRVDASEMISSDDPDWEFLLAPHPKPHERLEASELPNDEVASQRWLRRRAA